MLTINAETDLINNYILINVIVIIILIIIYYLEKNEIKNIPPKEQKTLNNIKSEQTVERLYMKSYENKVISIKEIKITRLFKSTPPKPEKLANKEKYYLTHRKFKDKIVINCNNYLQDGYTTYLLALKYDIKTIKVIQYMNY